MSLLSILSKLGNAFATGGPSNRSTSSTATSSSAPAATTTGMPVDAPATIADFSAAALEAAKETVASVATEPESAKASVAPEPEARKAAPETAPESLSAPSPATISAAGEGEQTKSGRSAASLGEIAAAPDEDAQARRRAIEAQAERRDLRLVEDITHPGAGARALYTEGLDAMRGEARPGLLGHAA